MNATIILLSLLSGDAVPDWDVLAFAQKRPVADWVVLSDTTPTPRAKPASDHYDTVYWKSRADKKPILVCVGCAKKETEKQKSVASHNDWHFAQLNPGKGMPKGVNLAFWEDGELVYLANKPKVEYRKECDANGCRLVPVSPALR